MRIDELARPQFLVIVGEYGLELDGGGGLIDDVVDQEELARGERALDDIRDAMTRGPAR